MWKAHTSCGMGTNTHTDTHIHTLVRVGVGRQIKKFIRFSSIRDENLAVKVPGSSPSGSTFFSLVSGHPQALLAYLQKMSSHCYVFLNCLQKEMLQVCDIHVINFLYLPVWQTLHHQPRGLIL